MVGDDAAAAAIRAWLRRPDEAYLALLLFGGNHAGAAAHRAFVFSGEFETPLAAGHRLFQRDPHLGIEVGRFLRARLRAEAEGLKISATRATRGKGRVSEAEKLREEVAHVAGIEACTLGTLPTSLASRVTPQDFFLIKAVLPISAELVVLAPFLGIAEDLVGLVDFLELRLGLLVVRIYVRMIFPCELAVGRFDIGFRSVLFDAEDFVI